MNSLRLFFLSITLSGLLVLAACGGTGDQTTQPPAGGNGTGGQATQPPAGDAGGATDITVGVQGNQLKFDQEQLTVKSGQQVNLTFNNTGALPHSFVIDELDVAIPENALDGMGPGQSGSATFTAPEPGEYEFYCGVPGHKEGNMVGTLTVTE